MSSTLVRQLLARIPVLVAGILCVSSPAQIVRPGIPDITFPINPGGGPGGGRPGGGGNIGGGGGGVIVGGGGIGGGGGIFVPINPQNPGFGGAPTPGPRIVTENGMLAGGTSEASVILPQRPATAAAVGQGSGTATPTAPSYQWTISGGRITSDPAQASVRFTSDTAGTVSLNVVVIEGNSSQSATFEVAVLSPLLAGEISSISTARAGAAPLTASVPAAQNGDRTFRWSLAGTNAAIMSGQGTNRVTFRPGSPGLLEVTCDVTLQRLATVTVRSFVVVTGDGPSVALTVNSGTGGGTLPAGSRVDVFADPPAAGKVFDKWIGDVSILGSGPFSASSAHAVATIPSSPATLTATYRSVPEWTPAMLNNFNPIPTVSPSGTTFAYHLPFGLKGLVFLLHDAGETGSSWFSAPERLIFVRDLVAAGYGVAALTNVNRAAGWNRQSSLSGNPDLATLAAALNWLAEDGRTASHTPLLLIGVGNGGDAATRYAQQLVALAPSRPVKGVVLYCSGGDATAAATSSVPQLFALAPHDDALDSGGTLAAQENSRLISGRGVVTEMLTTRAAPVPAGRLRALAVASPDFSSADAQSIWDALKRAALLDDNNYPKAVPSEDTLRAILPASLRSRADEVVALLAIGYGAPGFHDGITPRVIAFLNERLASAPAPAPGRLVNLSTRSSISHLGDSFTLGFILTGTERATVLVRGVGPALTRFGVADPLPAPRLQLHRGAILVESNDAWDAGANATEIVAAATSTNAFPLARGSRDAALLVDLEPGAYTATLSSVNGAVGPVLAEVYDVSRNSTRFTNLSTFGKAGADREPLVPGIVIAGNAPRTLVVRAIGPGLVDMGVPAHSVLEDPRLAIANQTGQPIANNNNWTQTGVANESPSLPAVFAAAGAFPLRTNHPDAALVSAFSPGSYLLQITQAPTLEDIIAPAASPIGSVLVEVYEVP